MERKLLFSQTKKDFKVETFCVGGHGGQNMQKNETGVRITHIHSGAVGESRDERSQLQNKKRAFERCINRPEFKAWHKIECARQMGQFIDIDEKVRKAMKDENLKVEMFVDGKWVPYEEPTDGNG